MEKWGRITGAQIVEAFNNITSIVGLTTDQIKNHLKSKDNGMTNISDKDVKIAIHRGLQSNALFQSKPKGRFFLCNYFCKDGAKEKEKGKGKSSKANSKSPSRKNSDIVAVKSHHVRSHLRKKSKRGKAIKNKSKSFIEKSDLLEHDGSDLEMDHPLSAVQSKHRVDDLDSKSKRSSKSNVVDPTNRLSDDSVYCDSESDNETHMSIDGEMIRRKPRSKTGSKSPSKKHSTKSVSRVHSLTHLKDKPKYRTSQKECDFRSLCHKPSKKEKKYQVTNILEYSEPTRMKKSLTSPRQPKNDVSSSECSDDEPAKHRADVSFVPYKKKKKFKKKDKKTGDCIIYGKDIEFCKLCRKKLKNKKRGTEIRAIGRPSKHYSTIVNVSSDEDSSDEESN